MPARRNKSSAKKDRPAKKARVDGGEAQADRGLYVEINGEMLRRSSLDGDEVPVLESSDVSSVKSEFTDHASDSTGIDPDVATPERIEDARASPDIVDQSLIHAGPFHVVRRTLSDERKVTAVIRPVRESSQDIPDPEFPNLPLIKDADRDKVRRLEFGKGPLTIRDAKNHHVIRVAKTKDGKVGILVEINNACERVYKNGFCKLPDCRFYHGEPGDVMTHGRIGSKGRKNYDDPTNFLGKADTLSITQATVKSARTQNMFLTKYDPETQKRQLEIANRREKLEAEEKLLAEEKEIERRELLLRQTNERASEPSFDPHESYQARMAVNYSSQPTFRKLMGGFRPLYLVKETDVHAEFTPHQRLAISALGSSLAQELLTHRVGKGIPYEKAKTCIAPGAIEGLCGTPLVPDRLIMEPSRLKRGEPAPYVCMHCLTAIFCSAECAHAAGHLGNTSICHPHPNWKR